MLFGYYRTMGHGCTSNPRIIPLTRIRGCRDFSGKIQQDKPENHEISMTEIRKRP